VTRRERILRTRLGISRHDGNRVVVEADQYHVAVVSRGMNDQPVYALLFAKSVEMYEQLDALRTQITESGQLLPPNTAILLDTLDKALED